MKVWVLTHSSTTRWTSIFTHMVTALTSPSGGKLEQLLEARLAALFSQPALRSAYPDVVTVWAHIWNADEFRMEKPRVKRLLKGTELEIGGISVSDKHMRALRGADARADLVFAALLLQLVGAAEQSGDTALGRFLERVTDLSGAKALFAPSGSVVAGGRRRNRSKMKSS